VTRSIRLNARVCRLTTEQTTPPRYLTGTRQLIHPDGDHETFATKTMHRALQNVALVNLSFRLFDGELDPWDHSATETDDCRTVGV
jgi:hypothetical protein